MLNFKPSKSEIVVAASYAIAAALTIAAAIGLEYVAFVATRHWPWRSLPEWFAVGLNVLPSALAGAVVFGAVTLATRRWIADSSSSRLLPRAIAPLLLVTYLFAVISMNSGSPDWFYVEQLYEWPFIAIVAGLATEAVCARALRRGHAAA